MGPLNSPRTPSTSNKSYDAPDPAESTLPKESRDADDGPHPEISPKTEVTPLLLTDSVAPLPEVFRKGENCDPESDPFLDTPSGGNSRPNLFHSSGAKYSWRTPSQPPPSEPFASSKEDDDPEKPLSSRKPSQRRTSLSPSPELKPNIGHARAISAPPPASRTIEKLTIDPQPGKLSDDVRKALEKLGTQRKLGADLAVETPGRKLWLFNRYESRGKDITDNQKQDILADALLLNSESSSDQPAGVGGTPAILVEQPSDGEDPSEVRLAPGTPPLQSDQPNRGTLGPLEKAVTSASSSATPLCPEKAGQNNSTRPIAPMKKRPDDFSVSPSAAIAPLDTSPPPFFNSTQASYGQWQQSSPKVSEMVKSQVRPGIQALHQKSSHHPSSTRGSEKKTENHDMDQLQSSDSSEAESMLARLLGLKYFQGAQSSLDQLSSILRLLQQRDSHTSAKLMATQKERAHVKPNLSASVINTEKLCSGRYREGAPAGSDVSIEKPVQKEVGRQSSNPQEPGQSSLHPVPSSNRGRSVSESAIPTSGKIFPEVPGIPTDVDSLSMGPQFDIDVRFTPSRDDGETEKLTELTPPEENITIKVFEPCKLPQKFQGTKLPEHLTQEIRSPIKRDVKVGKPHHGRIYMYWVKGNFGLVKIGFTTKTPEERLQGWLCKCKRTPYPINLNRDYPDDLPHVGRIELLIHTELREERVRVLKCTGCGGGAHKEWFVVTIERAQQVTQKWCDWMQQNPYERIKETPYKSDKGKARVREVWRLKQEHVDSLLKAGGELLFQTGGESSSRRRSSSLLEPLPAPATAPPKLQSRFSSQQQLAATSPRTRLGRSLSSAARLSNPNNNNNNTTPKKKVHEEGRTAAAAPTLAELQLPAPATAPPKLQSRFSSQQQLAATSPRSSRRGRSLSGAARLSNNNTTSNKES